MKREHERRIPLLLTSAYTLRRIRALAPSGTWAFGTALAFGNPRANPSGLAHVVKPRAVK